MRVLLVLLILMLATILAGCVDDAEVDPAAAEDLLAIPEAVGVARLLPVSSFEPTIGITSSGALFVTGGDTPRGPEHQTLFRSTDQGLTWEDVTDNIAGVTNYPPNSNDPYVHVDRDTDRVFDFEMQGLSCNMMAFSDDEGETWTRSPLGCTPTQGLQDHQTLFTAWPRPVAFGQAVQPVGYEKVVVYCVNRVADTGCATSWDGGLTWGPFRALVYDGIDEDKARLSTVANSPLDVVCSGLSAHGAGGPDGTMYLPRGDCGGYPTVAISKDNGINWQHRVISEDVLTYGAKTSSVPYHEVNIGIDGSGNVFATWKGEDRRVKFAASYDAGGSWTDAIDITPEGVNVTEFPVITAGAEGRVAVAFIGTDADPGKKYHEMEIDDHWHAHMVLGTELHNENATWEAVQLTPDDDPIARGICGGTRCTAPGGGLGDFIDIEIDDTGRPWGVFVDVCHEECIKADEIPEGENSVNDKALAFVGTIDAGPALRGALAPLPALLQAETETVEE